jgi:3-hydroxymyristoyl/3-hydroxydecanoyl-(acyl carrier protein) dehydratase
VTRLAEPGWIASTGAPAVAAPLRAVDHWRSERDNGRLTLTVRVAVRGDDPNLRGHFPGLAVFPGVFVIEALWQAMAHAFGTDTGRPPVLRAVRSVRFLAPLLAGDELTLQASVAPRPGGGWSVSAVGTRQDATRTARVRADFDPPDSAGARAEAYPPPAAAYPPPAAQASRAAREHADVRAVLPQRHPLLLVDRVLDIDPGRSIRTTKAISGTEPCYAALPDGAEPWRYDYPCSLLIESLGQSAALLWLDGQRPAPDDGLVLMFAGARSFHFAAAARPGDVLRHEVRLDSVIADTAFASGRTWAGDRLVSTVDSLVATRRPVRAPGSALSEMDSAWGRSTDGLVSLGEGSR